MRERGRERNKDSSYRHHARLGRSALSREYTRSQGRSRQRRSVNTGYKRVSRSKKFNHEWGYDRLISIYSPQRRSQSRRRFGFLKYLEIVAKKKRLHSNPSIVVEGKSYADAVKGQEEMKYGKTGSQLKQIRPETMNGKKGSIPKNSKIEQRKIWRVKNRGTEWRGLEYNVKEEDYEWLQGCYVGIACSVEMVPNIQEKFYIEGYFSCRLRAMGGKMVLMDCEDKEELKDLVQGAADWLGQWFSEVKPWSPLMVAKEQFVWIRCQGTPLQAWGPAFFESMAAPWGKFICLDDSTSQKRRFDIARFLISTQIMDLISVKRQIKVNGEVFCIKFTEEEMTNSLFSLRYDFLPSFKSESEHEEYWLEASDYDDEWQDDEWGTNRERVGEKENAVGDTVGHSTNDKRHAVSSANEEEFELEERDAEAGQFEKADGSSQCRLKEWETVEEVADSIDEGTVNEVQDVLDEKGREKEASTNNQTSSDPIQVSGDELWVEQATQTKGNMGHKQNVVKGLVERQWACNKMGTIERRGPIPLNKNAKKKGSIINMKALEDVRRSHSSSLRADKGIEDSNEMEGPNKVGDSAQRVCKDEGMQLQISKQAQDEGNSAQVERWEHKHEEGQLQIPKQKGLKGAKVGFFKESEGNLVQILVNKNREKRTKSCRSVYLKAQLSGVMSRNNKGRERSKESKPGTVGFPEFLSNGKDEVGVIQDLEEMEKRDRKEKEAEGSKGGSKHKKESKMEGIDRSTCRMIWGSYDLEWVARDAEGLSRGMLCIWNSKKFKMGRVLEGTDFIGVEGVWGVEQFPASIINVYSPCQLGKKRILWEELKALVVGRGGNWCIMGDFNAVRKVGERGGSRETLAEMREFDSFIRDVEFVDLPLVGRKFTWWGLNRIVFDHCPILLKQQEVDWGPKPFKFFDTWLEQEGCRELIKETWSKVDIQGWAGYRIKEKLKMTKEALRKWSKEFVPETDRKINNATTEIAQIDLKGEAEIKEAIRDCDSSKAPGPDGFNFKFVKDQWEVDNPQKIEEYRSISLIGVVYKILAKILANRLKKVLDTVIGEQQMAFLRGRQLMDGVVIANEVVEEAKKKKTKAFLFKIDFEKAYDKVCWDFLDYMMQRMGFSAKWRNLIQECLRTTLVSVLVNGSPTSQFSVSRGLRKIAFWKSLIDVFSSKLSKWKGRFLFLEGRITLINSVLDSLPVFWMLVYLIPKGTILLLDQIRRRFLWGGTEGGKKINWVKWEVVCKDKKKGGLGVKDLRKFNMALLGKWWGRLVSEERGLWKKIIFEKYGKVGEPSYYWLREESNSGTKWWRDICSINTIAGENRGWVADGFRLKVGEGGRITKFLKWENGLMVNGNGTFNGDETLSVGKLNK
ncbi:hypothetical protein SLEP1_g7656 [Rubroshorea leprosula]|uniref:Reverse transcriptase domain-containing protein n=1 Tax=Rubroshorea leprosula TaxID=152421 RepID=A0AAV5HZB3_9ROSI|nr:hypothetical protein SLEP1_g7656 [Rubroshorea leprosula]